MIRRHFELYGAVNDVIVIQHHMFEVSDYGLCTASEADFNCFLLH